MAFFPESTSDGTLNLSSVAGDTVTEALDNLAAAGGGDVSGPGSSVDDNLAAFDGTDGKTIKDSGVSSAGGNLSTTGYVNANNGYLIGDDLILNWEPTAKTISIGEGAGLSITSTGIDSVFVGRDAGTSTTTGDQNVAVGYGALYTNTAGDDNVAIGSFALFTFDRVGGGGRNTAIGYDILRNQTTGQNNTAIGALAGTLVTTGSNNIIIGHDAEVKDGTASNQISIGNTIYGDTSAGTVDLEGNLTLTPATDATIAYQIKDSTGATVELSMNYADDTGFSRITAAGILDISTDSSNLVLAPHDDLVIFPGSDDKISIVRDGTDSVHLLEIDTTSGTGGGIMKLNVSGRDPVGNSLAATQNTLWSLEGGSLSNLLLNVSSSGSTTDWISLRENSTIVAGNRTIQQNSTTRYLNPVYSNGSAGTALVQMPMRRGRLHNMRVVNNDTTGANANNIVVTTQKGTLGSPVNTSLAVTIDANVGYGTDLSNFVDFDEGDFLSIVITKPEGATDSDSGVFIVTYDFN